MYHHPDSRQSISSDHFAPVPILNPLTREGYWRHHFRASFRFGGQQIDASCYDYQDAARDPVALTETLREAFFTDVALYLDLASRTSKSNVYLSDFLYEVDGVVYEFRAPQVVEVEGTLGTLHLHKPITVLLVLPMARRGETFTFYFGHARTEITLPHLSRTF